MAATQEDFDRYLDRLQELAALILSTGIDPMRLPATRRAALEAKALAPVFAFMGARRRRLRRLIHPLACQYAPGTPTAESSADRGDEVASLYHTIVLGTVLPEEPKNWSLRDRPDLLRETFVALLGDLRHLADAAELTWRDLLSEALASYEDDRRD